MLSARGSRRLHRFLGMTIGIQLLLWTASGIYFAWTDLDEIHGDHLRDESPPFTLGRAWISPTDVSFEKAGLERPRELHELGLVRIADRVYYRMRGSNPETSIILADVLTGTIRAELSREEAVELARASFRPEAPIESVEYLTKDDIGPHHEYRGGPVPAWAIQFDHSSATRVYVAAGEGTVTKHRNRGWRVFDLLWMLHTMDYRGRDDFNNPLLRAAAVLALTGVLTGFLLWAKTSSLVRGRSPRRVDRI